MTSGDAALALRSGPGTHGRMWVLMACEAAQVDVHGVVLTDWSGEGYHLAAPALATVADQGFDTVVVLVTWYVDGPGDVPHVVPGLTPSDDAVRFALAAARDQGLRTGLKVHVDPADGSWRGDLAPTNPAAWMKRYGELVRDAAGLAADEDAQVFVVGTELELLVDAPEWPAIIEDVRSVFDGDLTYAANWDGYTQVPFWDQLDEIGVDAYHPVEDWPSARRRLSRFAGGRPVWLTELGYQSRRGTCVTPWWSEGRDDGRAQAGCYERAFDEIGRANAVSGVFLWHMAAGEDLDDFGWTGKPAEVVVRQWLAAGSVPR